MGGGGEGTGREVRVRVKVRVRVSSLGQQPCKFIVTKESVLIEKKSSTFTGLVWDANIEVACEQVLCLGKG